VVIVIPSVVQQFKEVWYYKVEPPQTLGKLTYGHSVPQASTVLLVAPFFVNAFWLLPFLNTVLFV